MDCRVWVWEIGAGGSAARVQSHKKGAHQSTIGGLEFTKRNICHLQVKFGEVVRDDSSQDEIEESRIFLDADAACLGNGCIQRQGFGV